jgi:hypothetical protein
MSKVLVVYASRTGHTSWRSTTITSRLQNSGAFMQPGETGTKGYPQPRCDRYISVWPVSPGRNKLTLGRIRVRAK